MQCACGTAIDKPSRGPTPERCATCRAGHRRELARQRAAAKVEPEPLRVIALGAGQQSTAMLLMSLAGVLPRADCAVFCDTQAERRHTVEHLTRLKAHCDEVGFPLHIVSAGDLWSHVQESAGGRIPIPAYGIGEGGRRQQMHQHCTADAKVAVIRRFVREQLDMAERGRPGDGKVAELWLGISLDETGRMRDNSVEYIRHRYPLVDAGLDRTACVAWLAEHWPHPVWRSSCMFCPFQSQAEWQQLRAEDPAGFRAVVALDGELRDHDRFPGGVYLHRSLRPLLEAVTEPAPTLFDDDAFGADCQGMCGI
jgi:hypothetical protein